MLDLIVNVAFCLCAFIVFVSAAVRYLRPRQALYKKMIACAMGCIFLERLYKLVQILIIKSIPEGFDVGIIGVIGSYIFIFSANYGAIDSLIDNKSKELKKYRIIALIGTLMIIVPAVIVLTMDVPMISKLCMCAEQSAMALAVYYNIKHMIIPEEYADMFVSLRQYNASIILLAVSMTIENLSWYANIKPMFFVGASLILQSIIIMIIIPLLESGIRRWKI